MARMFKERGVTMAQLNVMKTIEEARKDISAKYDVSASALNEIIENFYHPYSIASAAFALGYAQGMKAARAEENRKKM